LIPKGVLAVLLRLFSGRTADEIIAFDAKAGLDRLGLASMLTPSRSNGLYNMLNRIRLEALQAA
jgi:cysteine desulfuration protein SufE